jgi:hypothetical protein
MTAKPHVLRRRSFISFKHPSRFVPLTFVTSLWPGSQVGFSGKNCARLELNLFGQSYKKAFDTAVHTVHSAYELGVRKVFCYVQYV